MSISIGDALLKLGVDSKDLEKGMAEAEKNVQKAGQNIEKSITKITVAATAMGAALIAGIMKITTDYGKLGEELINLNIKTGISVKGLSELKYMAESAGASLSDVEMASKGLSNALGMAGQASANLQKKIALTRSEGEKRITQMKAEGASVEDIRSAQEELSQSLAEMSDTSSAATQAFEKLGLSYQQLQAMNPEQRFWAVANALAAVTDANTRAALAQDVFGRSGTNLLPILAQGTAAIEAQRKTANDLGVVMDDFSAKKAAAFDQAMDDMKAAFDGLKMALAEDIIPVLKDFIILLTDKLKVAVKWFKDNPGWVDSLKRFGEILAGIIVAGTIIKIIGLIQKLVTAVRTYITAMVIAQSVSGWGIAKVLLGLGAAAAAMIAIDKMFETPTETIGEESAGAATPATTIPATIPIAPAKKGGLSMNEWRATMGLPPLPGFAFGGIVPGPIGQPVPIMAHGGESYSGLHNIGKTTGNNVTVNLGVLPGDDVTIRRVVRMIKDILGEDSRRNSFGQVNQGYFYGRSSV